MTRPRKPDMTDEEDLATAKVGTRSAARRIGDMRGAATYPQRAVSHAWVADQRRLRTQRNKTLTVKEPESQAASTPTDATPENPTSPDIREPEPHQGGRR